MIPNHYATLGLSPASEDVVIRAAYLALMRRYHPDRNPSAEAAEQARAIAEAYAVIGDPERRAEYDHLRAQEAWPMDSRPRPAMSAGGPFAAASLALLLAIVALVVWSPLPSSQAPRLQADAPRQAAEPKSPAPEPVEIASLEESAAAPPSTAPAERKLPAPQPQVEANRPAPALAPPPARQLAQASAPPIAKARPASLPKTDRAAAPQPAVARTTTPEPKPSFSCQVARTRGEIAVCRNGNLANLDRQQALLYSQSWGRADAAKRAQLLRTRERFISQRDSCRSDSCTSGVYLARMREVSEIMTGGAATPR